MTFIHFMPYNSYFCNKTIVIMTEKEKKERTVIHLYIKENNTHHYFGSIAMYLNTFHPKNLE